MRHCSTKCYSIESCKKLCKNLSGKVLPDQAYEKYIGLISSVRKCSSNKFSEVLISTNGVNVVGRFVADPYSTALFSTEDKDYAFLLQKEKEGVSKHEAIAALSKKYGELPDIEDSV